SGKSLIAYSESELSSMGREAQKSFVRYTLQIMRAVLMEKQGLVHLQPTSTDQQGFVQKFAQHYSIDQIDEMVRLLNEAYLHIERNANSKLLFLDLSLQLVLLFKYNTFRIEADSII